MSRNATLAREHAGRAPGRTFQAISPAPRRTNSKVARTLCHLG
jgi:hypothetical protein